FLGDAGRDRRLPLAVTRDGSVSEFRRICSRGPIPERMDRTSGPSEISGSPERWPTGPKLLIRAGESVPPVPRGDTGGCFSGTSSESLQRCRPEPPWISPWNRGDGALQQRSFGGSALLPLFDRSLAPGE